MVDNCSVYEFELYESRLTHVAMECTNIEDFILISAGYHLEALEKELEKCIPDRWELVRNFNEVKTVYQQPCHLPMTIWTYVNVNSF